MGWFSKSSTPPVLRIQNPKLGILDLSGGQKNELVAADLGAVSNLFTSTVRAAHDAPPCNVLLIYADISLDGVVQGATGGLRDIIRQSGAVVVFVASPNDSKAYIHAGRRTGYGQANLVMTLDRKGDAFPKFLASLFALMKKGVSMPVAWVQLAPQVPGKTHVGLPESIFASEVGQVAFA